jgi:hypothetical protein
MLDTYLPLFHYMPHLLQAATSTAAENAAKNFGIVEQLLLTNGGSDGIFANIMRACTPIAAIGIAFKLYEMIPKFSDVEEIPGNITKLFWALVLAFIIGNGGSVAKDLAVFNWSAIRAINVQIDKSIERLTNLAQLTTDLQGDVDSLRLIEAKLTTCERTATVNTDGTPNPQFTTCRSELEALIQADIRNGNIKNPSLIDKFTGILGAAFNPTVSFTDLSSQLFGVIGGAAQAATNGLLKIVFAGWRAALNQAAQYSLFLAILSLPIPLCLSVFNISPLAVWFSSFWAVGIYQFSMTILTKSFEYYNVRFGTTISVFFVDIAICFFAPAIAGLMATGGGIGMFKAILNGAGEVAKLATKIPIEIAKKAILKS